ncbi:MAG TPA: CGNR zinc finger domain-containing protein [Amycolatopsis sp.]|uniref:CGNR zinc finger domain-containing protein n=1 Tax=Amycolatopsis sp. TaxID=37632 RepID=UPI002B47E6E4|nr:CGNR zinc finger domain-containing protein [Amycolatopsis sp.]HKS49156.1 CGNR zinc finger domain-containing protein [Amycolatopsis sp.]
MASVVVDGLTLPISIGRHPALDFCNTRAGWENEVPKEYLRTHAHLSVWARENGLVTASAVAEAERHPATAAAVLDRALVFRQALYQVFVRAPREDDWETVDAEVRRAAAHATLRPGAPVATWALAVPDPLELPLLAVAWAAANLLTTTPLATISACPGDGCGWLFTDPRGRRRWCSMAICGNRAKARRHTEKHRQP